MFHQDKWLLPAGITEILPEEAADLEQLRRRLIDLYQTWGYQLVIPPLIEYLESLLIGGGRVLDLQTFKLTDPLTGRLMGIRADMTPQVARIDAHHLKRGDIPTRLCYLGTVLHTRPNNFAGSRSPLQVGAELYGHSGIAADVEILTLMIETLKVTGITEFHIDVGHVKLYQGLIQQAQLSPMQENQLDDAMKRKDSTEIHQLLSDWHIPAELFEKLRRLPQLHGDRSVLAEARTLFANDSPQVQLALNDLEQLDSQFRQIPLHFDLAELRGYRYHTGVVFAAYLAKQGQAVAKGGRYDEIGKTFGRARAATGFSANLRNLISLLPQKSITPQAVFAPDLKDETLDIAITELRKQGTIVIRCLPQQSGDATAMGCNRILQLQEGQWHVVPL